MATPIEVRCRELDATYVARLIEEKIALLGVHPDAVSSIIVASDETDFGDRILHSEGHDGGVTHTDDTLARAMPFRNSHGVTSDIFLMPSVFTECQLVGEYPIAHELAHAVDFHARQALGPLPFGEKKMEPATLAAFYVPNILSEFAACFIAATACADEHLERMRKGFTTTVIRAWHHFRLKRSWEILQCQAQVAGSTKKATLEADVWPECPPNMKMVLKAFVNDDLRGLRASYPNWNGQKWEIMLKSRCLKLTSAIRETPTK